MNNSFLSARQEDSMRRANARPFLQRLAATLTLDLFIQHSARLGKVPQGLPVAGERLELLLADSLPGWILDRITPQSLAKLARWTAETARRTACGSLDCLYRVRRGLRRISYATRGDERRLFRKHSRGEPIAHFGDSLELLDCAISARGLTMTLGRVGELRGPYLFFVHLHSHDERRAGTVLSLDREPVVSFMEWPGAPWVFDFVVPFDQVPPGSYRIFVGIYEPLLFTKLPCRSREITSDSFECGTVTIGSAAWRAAA